MLAGEWSRDWGPGLITNKLCTVITSGILPLDNICFRLFLHLINFLSTQAARSFRYQEQTLTWWYVLLKQHGEHILRTCGGLKLYQIIPKRTDYWAPSDICVLDIFLPQVYRFINSRDQPTYFTVLKKRWHGANLFQPIKGFHFLRLYPIKWAIYEDRCLYSDIDVKARFSTQPRPQHPLRRFISYTRW